MNSEKFLVVNGGSSSLKFSLFEMPNEKELLNGYIEKLGQDDCFWTIKKDSVKIKKQGFLKNHSDAVKVMIDELLSNKVINSIDEIKGIGHRVLHGGEIYNESVIIDNTVISDIKNLTKLGPLHHVGELAGILALQNILPQVKQVAVFDTSFHQTIPNENYIYPVPYEWYKEYGVRKYGFHGTSHKYITEKMKNNLEKEDINLIICHIGSGASISAIKDGKCYDTSMGLTPLDGLMMGTRSGAIDPSIINYIAKCTSLNLEEINAMLNSNSGLLGIAGKSDYRDIISLIEQGNERAILAYKMFKKSIRRFIIEYYLELNGQVDAIIFTAGIGENAIKLRADLINELSFIMPIHLDIESNDNIAVFKDKKEGIITTCDSNIPVYVVPTNEEIMILRDTLNIIEKEYQKTYIFDRR